MLQVVATRLLKLWPSVIMEEEVSCHGWLAASIMLVLQGLLKDSVETAEALYYAGHLDFFEVF